MKIVISLLVFCAAFAVKAQTTLNGLPANEDTTITIKKGALGTAANPEKTYEFLDGEADIEGDPDVLVKSARANWKKECAEWKKELKEDNKDNQVLLANCGKMVCVAEDNHAGTSCKSQAKYKIKVKMK